VEEPIKDFKIYRDDSWLKLLSDYVGGEVAPLEELKKQLSEKKLSVKDSDISYRVINHWMAEGLISDARVEEKGWRKLSLFDLIWINAIVEMRKFGIPIPTLRQAHKGILKPISNRHKDYNSFEMGVFLCLQHEPVYLVVLSDGWAEVARKKDIEASLQLGFFLEKSYLLISLNRCCENVLKGSGKANYPIGLVLNAAELEAIELIRRGELDSLEIIFKDGKPQTLKQHIKKIGANFDLNELTQKIEYGEITAKVQDGVIILAEVSNSKRVQ